MTDSNRNDALSNTPLTTECESDLPTSVKVLWRKFNVTANQLSVALGRTSNIVGEYAEYLANEYYRGCLLKVSGASADIKTADGTRYQVKSRKISGSPTTQLNVIRSWDFDFLVVILFIETGEVYKAIEIPMSVAQEYAKRVERQGGCVITTSRAFLTDVRGKDITTAIAILNSPDA